MRGKVLMLVTGAFPLAASGCNLAYYASHNLVNEPITRADEHKLTSRLKTESRVVWRDICRQFPARTFTPEFADGFTDGYADHLENGGPPGPPIVPPLRYRRANYLTPEGHALIRDYLIGFQYGQEVAVATGKRNFLTVPVLLKDAPPETPLNVIRYATPPKTSTDGPLVPSDTPLPPPKPVEAAKPGLPDLGNPIPAKPGDGVKPEPKPLLPAIPGLPTVPDGGVPKLELPRSELPKVGVPTVEVPKVGVPALPVSRPTTAPPNPNAMPIVDVKILPSGAEELAPTATIPPQHEPPKALPPGPTPEPR